MKKTALLSVIAFMLLAACAPVQRTTSTVPELFVKWEMYPDPRKEIVNPGEEIVFKLDARSTTTSIHDMTLDFGDGTQNNFTLTYYGKNKRNSYACMPIHASHAYREDNLYRPVVKYEYGTCPSNIDSNETTFFIPPRVPTDDELKEMAFQDAIDQLADGINEVLGQRRPERVKFALTSLKNANFEYAKSKDDQRDIVVIKKITTSLVNKGYSVLEKNPQALIRLAHEAVVKKDASGKPSDEYQESLEYGLRTEYHDPKQPFYYGAEIEGVKPSDRERVTQGRRSSAGRSERASSREDRSGGQSGRATRRNNTSSQEGAFENNYSEQNRALYFAKFSTADYVITIDRDQKAKEDIYLTKSNPIYYNIKFQTKMIERIARLEFNARILSRNGNIVWIKDIRGEAKDRVIPDFVKTPHGRRSGMGFWDSLLRSMGN